MELKSILRALFVLIISLASTGAAAGDSLTEVEKMVEADFASVTHIDTEYLSGLNSENLIVIDVREIDEYSVSHLQSAVRVSPDIDSTEFMRRFKQSARSKTFVFYCSVGYRSSQLAEQLEEKLIAAGASAVANLRGGIFGWHNEERPVFNQQGQTTAIHPYNNKWGQLVRHQQDISYQPD
jgi:rhodanese-related sulfurtransferase